MKRKEAEHLFLLKRELKIREARTSFYSFCQTTTPSFYTKEKTFLKDLCDTLQGLYEKTIINEHGVPYRKVLLSVPPRHGKTLTKDHFVLWVLGHNPTETRIIAASYGKDLSIESSRFIRNTIMREKNQDHEIVYHDIFPETILSDDNASVGKWSLNGSFFTYKATSKGSAVTGMGTNFAVVDDLVKDHNEANNEYQLEQSYSWFRNTFLSREEGSGEGMFIVIGTRWNSKDPIGQLLESEHRNEWLEIKLKAYDENSDSMLCESILNKKQYAMLQSEMDRNIFLANYQQTPVDMEGRLYKNFLKYDDMPKERERMIAYVDTADTGSDFLTMIVAAEKEKELYVVDVLYTRDDMTITEPLLAQMLHDASEKYNCPIDVKIEGNNGGSNFARTVEKILWDDHRNRRVNISWFTQRQNKNSRILSHATQVQKRVFFPLNWDHKYPDFYSHLIGYQADVKANKHDDGVDCLTGLVEMVDDMKEVEAAYSLY